MNEDFDHNVPTGPAPSVIALALRKKIGWLCQLLRVAAVVWSGWILYLVLTFWSDRDKAAHTYAKIFGFEPASLPDFNYFVSFGLELAAWALTAVVALARWRLFSRYLSGEIFTVSAAVELRRLAAIGAAALIFSMAQRPIIFHLMIAGHDTGGRHAALIQPNDLLDAIFVTFLFSLAYIFKTAAELADEHAQIV
jgi:hypothetical protein